MSADTICKCADITCPVHLGTVCTNEAKNKIADVPFCDGCVNHSLQQAAGEHE